MSQFKIDDEFLLRVFKEEISSEEKDVFDFWLSQSAENRTRFNELITIWEKSSDIIVPIPPKKDQQWKQIKEKIITAEIELDAPNTLTKPNASQQNNSIPLKSRQHRINYGGIWIARAAALILITLSIYYFIDNYQPTKPAVITEENTPSKLYAWKTSKGEKATIPLSDGSIVYLNADSRLVYPKVFNNNERRIELVGEGYFVVAEDRSRPFLIVSENIVTEAVGTEFNVKFRNDKVQIVVVDGIVRTYKAASSSSVNINKGEMVQFSEAGGFSPPEKVDVTNHTAWRKNKLAFKNTPLNEVISELEIYFNIDAEIHNPELKSRRLSGVFLADSLNDVLAAISISMNVNIKREGRIIIVE